MDQLIDLDVAGGDVTISEDHPFWSETDRQWQDAQDLDLVTYSAPQPARRSP